MSTICLNMIVKNEAEVLPRCLESVRHLIDYWEIVVDEQSSDESETIIRHQMTERGPLPIPGELHRLPWRHSFGKARTEAFQLAKGKADYVLVLDADETIELDHMVYPGSAKANLRADSYMIRTVDGTLEYDRMRLLRADLDWRFVGVAHEYPECEAAKPDGRLEGIVIRSHADGARSKDPEKFVKAAEVLADALTKDPKNARYAFYLAESYRDAGKPRLAIMAYMKRAAMMGGWDEETWYSLYQIGVLRERCGDAPYAVCAAYLRAFEFRPTRAEPLYQLARYLREKGRFALAHLYAERASKIERPSDMLFLDASVYEWKAIDELAICEYWAGECSEAAETNRYLLSSHRSIPSDDIERIKKNLAFCEEKERAK